MKIFLYLLFVIFLIGLASSNEESLMREEFKKYCSEYQKICEEIKEEEKEKRYNIFVENYKIVENENQSNRSHKFKLNKFALYSKTEFASTFLMSKREPLYFEPKQFLSLPHSSLPDSLNWTAKGAVTHVFPIYLFF